MRTTSIAFVWLLIPMPLGLIAKGAENEPITLRFEPSGSGTQLVSPAAAGGKKALAIDIGALTGNCRLKTAPYRLDAGRYRVTLYARLQQGAADDDISRLSLELNVGEIKGPDVKKRMVWTNFDSTPDRFTPIEMDLTFPSSVTPVFDIAWLQTSAGPAQRVKPIRKPAGAPSLDREGAKPKLTGSEDLLGELESANKVIQLASLDYPAIIVDRITFEPISRTQLVEAVRPRFLHIYPGQPNPIEVSIRNLENRQVNAVARLEIRGGLDEVLHTASRDVTLPAGGSASCQFDWSAGQREFGHEARVTLLVDGKPVHAAQDYFSVSFPIWKTALQGSGFLTWYGREKDLPAHVAANRADYLNVEEAFSWQPSSWTDLNPKAEHWWTGQGDAHNNITGLKQWIGLSHDQGIKMITYLWSSASGPEGLEWVRENPELATHGAVGLPSEFLDVEDLRLMPITAANPRLWRLRSGVWNNVGVNRGMLRAIEKGMSETIASSERFGWDGARFDSPPGWSAMGAEDMHAEFGLLKVGPLMKKLVPEYYGQTTGTWNNEAVSVSNVRYARHRLRERDPRFALSFNFGGDADRIASGADPKFFDECCADGGQIMDEEIRQLMNFSWPNYQQRIQRGGEAVRRRGGYHCVVAPNANSSLTACYAGICTFIGGSHSYGDFGWSRAMPGMYTQFMTRYGEYCWARDLAPVAADEALFSVDAKEALWWRDLLHTRALADGRTQWVVHLVSPPPAELVSSEKPGKMAPWRRDLTVSRQTNVKPTVWALSAEPTTHATQLEPRQSGDRYVVELPEHRLWTLLVWTEPTR